MVPDSYLCLLPRVPASYAVHTITTEKAVSTQGAISGVVCIERSDTSHDIMFVLGRLLKEKVVV
jgi:hypothetical protein